MDPGEVDFGAILTNFKNFHEKTIEDMNNKVEELELQNGELMGELQGVTQSLRKANMAMKAQASRAAQLAQQVARQKAALADMVSEAAHGNDVFLALHANGVPVYLTGKILAIPEADAIMTIIANPALAKASNAPVVDTATLPLSPPPAGHGDGLAVPAPTAPPAAAVPAPSGGSAPPPPSPAMAPPTMAPPTVPPPPMAPLTKAPPPTVVASNAGAAPAGVAAADARTDTPRAQDGKQRSELGDGEVPAGTGNEEGAIKTANAGHQAPDSGTKNLLAAVSLSKDSQAYDPADLSNFDFDAEVVLGLKPRKGRAGARPAAAAGRVVIPRGRAVRGGWLRRCFGACWAGSPAS